MVGPDLAANLDPAPVGQTDIEDDDIRLGRRDASQRLGHGPRLPHHDDVAAGLEQGSQTAADDLVVVDQKDAESHDPILLHPIGTA